MLPIWTNIGEYIKTVINVVSPSATAEVTGQAVQIVGQTGGENFAYRSAQIALQIGAPAGAPTALSVTAQLETSPDGMSGWSAFTDLRGHGLITLAAASTAATANVLIQGAQAYLRLAVTPTFTGGTSPSVPVAGVIVLGGASQNPAA